MSTPVTQREALARSRRIERDTLEAIAAMPDRPEALAPFDELMLEQRWAEDRPAGGASVVGQLCHFAPDELILAAGARPVRLDLGCPTMAERGAACVSPDVCASVKASAAAAEDRSWPITPDLLVLPTPCDGKRKLAGLMAAQADVFVLELPPSRDRAPARSYWYSEIERLTARLEALTGRRITRGRLREAIDLCNRRTQTLRRLNRLRREDRPPIRGIDAMLVMQAADIAEPGWWIAHTEALIKELQQRVKDSRGETPRARLLLTGSPVYFPDFKLLRLIAEAGADVVADDLCSGTERLYHPTVADEWTRGGLIRAVADRSLLPSNCPCFVGESRRLDRTLERIKEYRADGVVHHTLRLCQIYEVDAVGLGAAIRERGVPWLQVVADLDPEESARLRNRVDAFVEMIANTP